MVLPDLLIAHVSRAARPFLAALVRLALGCALPLVAGAEPCALPAAPVAAIEHALGVLSHAPPPRPPALPNRLKVLLPARIGMGVRNGAYDTLGYTMGATSLSERGGGGTDWGWWLRMDWDLRPLWWTPVPVVPREDALLARAERAEHLAERMAAQLAHLRKAESLALQVSDGDLLCREAQADAESALLVIGALVAAAR